MPVELLSIIIFLPARRYRFIRRNLMGLVCRSHCGGNYPIHEKAENATCIKKAEIWTGIIGWLETCPVQTPASIDPGSNASRNHAITQVYEQEKNMIR